MHLVEVTLGCRQMGVARKVPNLLDRERSTRVILHLDPNAHVADGRQPLLCYEIDLAAPTQPIAGNGESKSAVQARDALLGGAPPVLVIQVIRHCRTGPDPSRTSPIMLEQ